MGSLGLQNSPLGYGYSQGHGLEDTLGTTRVIGHQDERTESHVTTADPSVRKRKTNGDEDQQASLNALVPKRKRPAAPRPCLGNEMVQRDDADNPMMQSKRPMSVGERIPNHGLDTVDPFGRSTVKDTLLNGSAWKPEPPQNCAAWDSALCNSDRPISLIGTEFDHHQDSSKYANFTTNEDRSIN